MAAVIYADDICLLAPCRSALQILLSACERYGLEWGLSYNPSKSKVMTFGKCQSIAPLTMYGSNLQFVDELKYLGVTLVSGKLFTTTIRPLLRKFRCASNTILNAHHRSSEPVLMKLIYAVAVPLITYACDSTPICSRQLNDMTIALNDVIRRIFSYQRWESVTFLRQTLGYLSVTEIVRQRTCMFMKQIACTNNDTLITLSSIPAL